jgi:hypothetical protein
LQSDAFDPSHWTNFFKVFIVPPFLTTLTNYLLNRFTAIEFFAFWLHFCANLAFVGLKCSSGGLQPDPFRALSSPLLSFFSLTNDHQASSHPPAAKEPPSLCPSPQRHAFPSPLSRLCSAGASVSSTELQQSHQADIKKALYKLESNSNAQEIKY